MTEIQRIELDEKLANYCANKVCDTTTGIHRNCDICMYEKGVRDAIDCFADELVFCITQGMNVDEKFIRNMQKELKGE